MEDSTDAAEGDANPRAAAFGDLSPERYEELLYVVPRHVRADRLVIDRPNRLAVPGAEAHGVNVRHQASVYSQFGSARGEKNRLAAALLAFFLGGIGVHRFYLGQVGAGVVMLLFCWTGIPWIVGMIDFVRYLVMSGQRFEALYG